MSSKAKPGEMDKESSSAETTSASAAASPSTAGEAQETSSSSSSPPSTTTAAATPTTTTLNPSRKVKVHFVPVGSAPILKKTKFQISADQRFAAVHAFLRKLLKMNTNKNANGSTAPPPPPLFLYLTSAFCPSQEEMVGELEECFSKRGELIVHYSLQEAWG